MSFDYMTLITDRTAADVKRLLALKAKNYADMTDAERAEWDADLKGAYNAADLNRITNAMVYLKGLYEHYGYPITYTPVYIDHASSRLPTGYTEMEYIQSSGTQYVNTGFQPNQDTRVIVDYEIVSFINSSAAFVYGSRIAKGNTGFYYAVSEGNVYTAVGYGNQVQQPTIPASGRHTAYHDKNVFYVDDTITFSAASFTSTLPIYLFALNQNGTKDSQVGNVRIYSCLIYDDDTIVRDFTPCINVSGAVGLYDRVSGQFYANSGTGAFAAGPKVASDADTLDPYTWYRSDIPTAEQMSLVIQNLHAFWVAAESATGDVVEVWADTEFGYVEMSAEVDTGDYTALTAAHGIRELRVSVQSERVSSITAAGTGWTIQTAASTLIAVYTVPNGVFQDLQDALDTLVFLCSAEDSADATVTVSALLRSGAVVQLGSGEIHWSAIINWKAFEAYAYTWQDVENAQMTWKELEQLPIPRTGGGA